MKVLVTGAYSTGKTALVEGLASTLLSAGVRVEVVTDTARECPLDLNSNQTDDTSLWLISMQVAREIAGVAADPEVLLCDRGVPDILAHQLEVETLHGRGRVALLDPFLADWLRSYDLVLFSRVDASIPVEPDGLRVTDARYRDLLDRHAATVMADLQAVVELPPQVGDRLPYATALVLEALAAGTTSASST